MEHTIEDIKIAKQGLEGSIINLIEEFVDKYNIDKVELNLLPIHFVRAKTQYDVEVIVKL